MSYTIELALQAQSRADVERDLAEALRQEQFVLMFQPQLRLATGECVASEALLRWNHPRRGLVGPADFLVVAEEIGAMATLGQWVVDEAVAVLGRWQAEGLEQRIAVNISPRQLNRGDFCRRLRKRLQESDLPLSRIEIELNEQDAIDASADELAELVALRSGGALITLDDFGSGRSDLHRLRALPIDRLKLDRALISASTTDPQAADIASALVAMARALRAEVVGKGVETQAEADLLRALGVTAGQGYHFAAPMFERDCRVWLTSNGARSVA